MIDAGENKLRNEFNCICMYVRKLQTDYFVQASFTNECRKTRLLYKDRRAGKLAVSLTQEFTPIVYACAYTYMYVRKICVILAFRVRLTLNLARQTRRTIGELVAERHTSALKAHCFQSPF